MGLSNSNNKRSWWWWWWWQKFLYEFRCNCFSFPSLSTCKLIRLFSHSPLFTVSSLLLCLWPFLVFLVRLVFSHSNSSGYFTLMSFTKKRAFMFSHFFPFIFFVFNCSVLNYNSNNNDALSNSAKRERLVCWIQRSLSRSLSSSVLLCFARALPRALSSHTQLCWLSENIKNARETFCSKLLTTFIISMCGCVCVCSNCLSTNCSCCTRY